MAAEAGTNAGLDRAYVSQLCQVAAAASNPPPAVLENDDGGHCQGSSTVKAPANLGLLVMFTVTQKSRKAVDTLVLQFRTADPSLTLTQCVFEPGANARWGQDPEALTNLGGEWYTKDFANLKAGLIQNGIGRVALYLNPGESVEWRLFAHIDASKVQLAVSELPDIRSFYKQYTSCLTLANEFAGAVELFQHHHTAEYERFLESKRQELTKDTGIGQRIELAAQIEEAKKELEDLKEKARLARVHEEAQQRSQAQQQQDEALAAKLAQLRATMSDLQTAACEAKRGELETAWSQEQDAEEQQASAAHEEVLRDMRATHSQEMDALAARLVAAKARKAKAENRGERLQAQHQNRLLSMEARKCEETQARIAVSRAEVKRDVESYYNRRAEEAATIQAEVRNIQGETKLFKTFYELARLTVGS